MGGANDPLSSQACVFADAAAADFVGALGGGWESVAASLRAAGFYVSGFTFEEGSTRHWITVRLENGAYASIRLEDDTLLIGALDQLILEAIRGGDPTPARL